MIVDIKDLEVWRKQNPDAKSVLVKHTDAVAMWVFGVVNPAELTFAQKLGAYMADGTFVFYDSEGNKHYVYKEIQSKMMINAHELWKS